MNKKRRRRGRETSFSNHLALARCVLLRELVGQRVVCAVIGCKCKASDLIVKLITYCTNLDYLFLALLLFLELCWARREGRGRWRRIHLLSRSNESDSADLASTCSSTIILSKNK